MKKYETMYIVRAQAGENEFKALEERLKQVLTTFGGTFVANQPIGKRTLSYLIGKDREGSYFLLQFEGSKNPALINELEKILRYDENVIRFMTASGGFKTELKVDFLDGKTFRTYITEHGRMISRRYTKLTAAQQRQMAKVVKRARVLSLLSFSTSHRKSA
ncbi:MAG: 30S ribosomal protein S6 [Deltaproteobacteria bacterium]|nr:30S ribosomal protein S6 [Deltaproteobacteria bacterium]